MKKQTKWSFKNFIPKAFYVLKKGYSFNFIKKDFFAGLTVAIISFPTAIAIARGVGLPPQQGIVAAIIGGFLASSFGGSQVLIAGPTSALIIALYSVLIKHGFDGLILVTCLSGLLLIGFGLMGLGTFIKYMPYPVTTGLTTGIAVTIFSSQITDICGLQLGDSIPTDFLGKWSTYLEYFWTWDPKIFFTGLLTLILLIYFRKYKPKLPGTMITLSLVSFVVYIFKINIPTIETTYGVLDNGFPPFRLPYLNFSKILILMPDALTIAVLSGIETLIAAVIADGMTGTRHQSNCQLVANGIANMGISCFTGLPISGSLSRTAANIKSGGSTPFSGIFQSLFLTAFLLFLGPLTSKIPLACLAAVLVMVAWSMSEIHHFIHLFTAPKKDVIILLSVFTLTVLTNITSAVQIGMMLAAFLFMKQMSDLSDVISTNKIFADETSPENIDIAKLKELPEEVEVYEINGPFFFGVADRLKNLLNEIEKPPTIFILRMRRVPTIDASAMHALEEFYLECERQGTTLLLAEIKKNPLRDLQRYQLDELIGEDHIFSGLNTALEFTQTLLRIEKRKQKAELS